MNLAIETQDLAKCYGDVQAVADLSLRVAEGEIYAFLGLNGAGKTTTMRMLLGMIKPTHGYANVLNTRVRLGSRYPWAAVGYLVETPHCYPELTVIENLEAARRLHPGTPRAAVGQIIERLGLSPYAGRRAGNLSLGNSQRLGLAKALLHHPQLIFLDEPANGLDPAGIVEIRALLLELSRTEGVTVFLSSHILAEVARLAERIGIIHQGRLLCEFNREALERERGRRLLLRARETAAALRILREACLPAELLPDGTIALADSASVQQPEAVNSLLVNAGAPPTHLVVEEEELETFFLRLVGVDSSTAQHSGGAHA